MKKILLSLAAIFLFYGCAKEDLSSGDAGKTVAVEINEDSSYHSGEVIVRFDDYMIDLIEEDLSNGKIVTKSMGLNAALDELGISSIERLFPFAGEFEPRTRASGLHKFYKVRFAETQPLTKAVDEMKSIPGIVSVEKNRKVVLKSFNDPKFSSQWHYYNNGEGGRKQGADVNVKPVWDSYTTGKSNVIVAVVDGGIDMEHEDLKDNVIPAGSNGSKNFVDGNFVIYPHKHGTHVAGTIGAVNNNGIGVCGLAGGDKAHGVAGVKLLSCQIFKEQPNGDDIARGDAEAIKWGADHGAVISQNSWGFAPEDSNNNGIIDKDELDAFKNMRIPSYIKVAIDYFIKHAGCDDSGNQLPDSPMKGGVVIFAAGNDNIDYDPICAYDPVISVGSMDALGNKSHFSNHGDWVDICAPGSSVLSTLPGNKYGKMSGTSMACPHVSGVAALIVSQFGGQGFTAQALKDKLLNGAKAGIVPPNAGIGKLVDALGAISYGGAFVPKPVTTYTCDVLSNNVDFKWNVTQSTSGKKAYGFMLMASKNRTSLENANPKSPGDDVIFTYVTAPENVSAGEEMSGILPGLEFNTAYYVAIAAGDYSSTYSALSPIKEITTLGNNPPVIEIESENVVVKAFETKKLSVNVSDPDGHKFKVGMQGGSNAIKIEQGLNDGEYYITITGTLAPAGRYSVSISATDDYSLSATKTLNYEILENQAPVKVRDFKNILLQDEIGRKMVFNGEDYISDPDGEVLTYKVDISDNNVIHINQSGSELYVTILGFGLSNVTITGTDALGESISSSFKVLVRRGDIVLEAYPNPVSDRLFIRTGLDNEETAVKIISEAGAVIYDKKTNFSAFEPLEVDLSKAAPGKYSVYVSYSGKTAVKTIVKN